MQYPDARSFERQQPILIGAINEQIERAGSLQNYLRAVYEGHITYDSDGNRQHSPELLLMQGIARFMGGSDPFTADQRDIDSIFRGELLGAAVARELLGEEMWRQYAHALLGDYLNRHVKTSLLSRPIPNANSNNNLLLDSIFSELTCDDTDSPLPDELEGLIMDWTEELSDDPSDQFNMTIGFRLIVQLVAKRTNGPTDSDQALSEKSTDESLEPEVSPFERVMRHKKMMRKYDKFVNNSMDREQPHIDSIMSFADHCTDNILNKDFMHSSMAQQIEMLNSIKATADKLVRELLNGATTDVGVECPGYFVTPLEFPMDFNWSEHFIDTVETDAHNTMPRGQYDGAFIPDVYFCGGKPFKSLDDFFISYGQPMLVLNDGKQLYWIPFSYVNGLV